MNVPSLTLVVDGTAWSGWLSAEVTRSIEEAASAFALGLTDQRDPDGNVRASARIVVRPGALCELRVDGETLITGYVDEAAVTGDAGSYTVAVNGRSKPADLIDSDMAETQRWVSQSALRVATDIAALHGLDVVVDAQASSRAAATVGRVLARTGDGCLEVLERVVRTARLLLTDTPQGAVRLTTIGTDRAAVPLEVGGNVLRFSARASAQDLFARYLLRSHMAVPDADDVDAWGTLAADFSDPIGARTRTKVISPERGLRRVDCAARAEWEASTRAGRAVGVECDVLGWRERGDTGDIWTPGRLVTFRDPHLAGLEAELVIADVKFTLDASGARTSLRLVPPAAYEPVPATTRSNAKRGSRFWQETEAYAASLKKREATNGQ